MAYIYKITNQINGKIYIGKTLKTIPERWKEHCSDYRKERCEKRPLYDAMNKYGIENFTIEEVEECSSDILNDREVYWIEQYGSFKYGYNATKGGDGKHYIDYDLVVSVYKELGSITDTANFLKISQDSVSHILREKNIKIFPFQTVIIKKYGKVVNMYNLDEKFLRSFPSISAAAKYMVNNQLTNCKLTTIKQHISEVCYGKRQTAAKYKWRFG